MILFKPWKAEKILARKATVTRRRGRRRWRVASIHQARTRLFGKAFARLRILSVIREEYPGESDNDDREAEARREGFETWAAFRAAFRAMHGHEATTEACWRVSFVLHEDVLPEKVSAAAQVTPSCRCCDEPCDDHVS